MLSTQKQGQERNKLVNELRLWQGLLGSLQGSTFPLSQDLFDSAICLLRIWEYRRKELEDQIRHSPKLRKPFGSELLRGKLGQIQALGNAFQTFSEDLHVRASQRGLNTSATNSIAPPPGYRSSLTAANSPNPRALGGTQASSRVPPRAVARNQPPGQGSGHPFTASQSAPAQSITQAPLPGMPTRNASGNDQALRPIPPQRRPTEALQTSLDALKQEQQEAQRHLAEINKRSPSREQRIDLDHQFALLLQRQDRLQALKAEHGNSKHLTDFDTQLSFFGRTIRKGWLQSSLKELQQEQQTAADSFKALQPKLATIAAHRDPLSKQQLGDLDSRLAQLMGRQERLEMLAQEAAPAWKTGGYPTGFSEALQTLREQLADFGQAVRGAISQDQQLTNGDAGSATVNTLAGRVRDRLLQNASGPPLSRSITI